jgi:hypothetical protein
MRINEQDEDNQLGQLEKVERQVNMLEVRMVEKLGGKMTLEEQGSSDNAKLKGGGFNAVKNCESGGVRGRRKVKFGKSEDV